jgi:hypothetical protein
MCATAPVKSRQVACSVSRLLSSAGCQAIELCPPPLRRDPPLRNNEPLVFKAIQRWVERPLVDVEYIARELSDPFRDAPTMQRLELKGLEDQEIQRPLEKISPVIY